MDVQQLSAQAGAYHDVTQLQRLKGQNLDDPATLGEISRQFEAMLAQQMLKSMRNANKIWSDDGLFNSDRVDFYQQMLDDQFSVELTRGDGLGMAEQFQRDLDRRFHTSKADSEASEINGENLLEERRLPMSLSSNSITVDTELSVFRKSADDNAVGSDEVGFSSRNSGEFSSTRQFVTNMRNLLAPTAKMLGVDVDALVAQAALESGWGKKVAKHEDGSSSYNLFGIKANAQWSGNTVNVNTLEFFSNAGIRVQDDFRAYGSFEESIADYAAFVQSNPRYQQALADTEHYPEHLQQSGYATDPNYAEKVRSIMAKIAEPPSSNAGETVQVAMTNSVGEDH